MGFLRQEYWSGLPIPSPGNIPNPKTEPESPAWQTDSLPLSHGGSPFEYACALSLKIQNLGLNALKMGLPRWLSSKESAFGDVGLIPELGKSLEKEMLTPAIF